MQLKMTGGLRALLAAVLTAMVVLPIAIAGAQAPSKTPGHHKAKVGKATAKQIKAIKKQAKGLASSVTTLNAQVAELNAKLAALEGKPAPTAPSGGGSTGGSTGGPPTGPAGGALTGSFPNPGLAANSVTSSQIADGTITSADVADGSLLGGDLAAGTIGQSNLAAGSVGAANIKGVQLATSTVEVTVNTSSLRNASVQCPEGSVMLGGGYTWDNPNRQGLQVAMSGATNIGGVLTWNVWARISEGSKGFLTAEAFCLNA